MALLEVRNLHASVGDREILKGVDLTIGDGEVQKRVGKREVLRREGNIEWIGEIVHWIEGVVEEVGRV